MRSRNTIRHPAVAGRFYPAEPSRLRADIERMVRAAPVAQSNGVCAVLAPHAGYPYSGLLAAAALRCVRVRADSTVVVIAPSHVEAFDFTSVFANGAYRTPLGDVEVDVQLANALCHAAGGIRCSPRGHDVPASGRGEHAVEVELPFLQYLHDAFRVVPIVMGSQSWQASVELGTAIAECATANTVIVASSDLSHFYEADVAERMDSRFLDALSTSEPRAVYDGVASGSCAACGAGPVVAALVAAAGVGRSGYELIGRAHSGDVTGDRTSVVGYAAAVLGAKAQT